MRSFCQSTEIPSLDTTETRLCSKRSRGVVLTTLGIKRLQAAIHLAELQENKGQRFSQEELSDRMRVSTKTLSRLWSVTVGLDQRTLKLCFSAFNLELRTEDYTTASANRNPDIAVEWFPKSQLVARLYKYPSGPEPLNSIFYISRPPIEELAYQEITQPGCFIRIKAPKEMGKSSLMYRVLAYGMSLGYQTVNLDMNRVDASILNNVDKFLRWFCKSVCLELNLELNLDDYWDEEIGSKLSCSIYFQYLLEHLDRPLVLALNEVNRIFEYPELAQEFLPLLRSWHESAQQELAWQKLRLVVIYSTEIYIPLDINHSPCNVGLPLQLPEFTRAQVEDLALRHGLDWRTGNQAEQLMAMVGGHPALVRIALYHLCTQEVTLPQLLQAASTEAGIYGAYLRRHLTTLQKNPELVAAIDAVIVAENGISLEPLLLYKLESQGLVKLNSDGVTISHELYRLYFQKYLFKR
ncbi:AAA-like domain-containing protein [Iningainema sp. BLCCT55]|uniref:AAA-like domain-containing protein n=2 Tax=Iningainema TaxID=1932705 RepID=A0A8J7CHK6_9CYAN|nr:AAA-like domain-containing protein [Iningainema tapete BLCC-T55]